MISRDHNWVDNILRILFALIIILTINEGYFKQSEVPQENQFASFPPNLYCSDIQEVGEGPAWYGIKIGTSSIENLEKLANALNSNYYFYSNNQGGFLEFSIDRHMAAENQIPTLISACATNQTISALRISLTRNPPLYLSNFLKVYGAPDVVTWVDGLSLRVAFWFEEGIAIDINIDYSSPDPSISYGQILSITYFPYQDRVGYETRWPFIRTRQPAPNELTIYEPPLSSEQNPFDFDAMIATITAESSWTSVAPLTPIASTPTATP